MSDGKNAVNIPPFPAGYRASGLLLHVTSLPSPYGIGDVGPSAFAWIDRLHDAGQGWWQALPLGPTGYGDSPYSCLSSFAGNGLLISPHFLIEDGLLRGQECEGDFSVNTIDYATVIPFKHRLLKTVWNRFRAGVREDLIPAYREFCDSRAAWLEDYSLYRALKATYRSASYLDWPKDLIYREPSALAQARRELASEIDRVRLAQFLLNRQARRLKEYARAQGVRLIGDLPFFVSLDSSDVWANPELFLLDEQRRPRFVAGVPPDYFSSSGQFWGNPVYNWKAHVETDYAWWLARIRALLSHVDVIRLDHFRAFAAAWHIPADAPTAESGQWAPGPGSEFFNVVRSQLGSLPFIAEDLGSHTPDVPALLNEFQIPGTKVLQFAFDGSAGNLHLPQHYATNTVVYTGTHDNATSRQWFEGLSEPQRSQLWDLARRFKGDGRDAAPDLIRLAWSSRAALAVTPLQDLLNLGHAGRMNVPGVAEGNWRWRATRQMIAPDNFQWQWLKNLTNSSKRSGSVQSPVLEAVS
jgi:4-alpha-glucanotransferase